MHEWRTTTWGDVITLQRGFDITKDQQVRDGDVPVVSSGGIASYHDQAMSGGPGVIIGRKGTLGRVHYVDGPYWPHDTTLWVKDFKGNVPRFVYYALQGIDPEHLNVGSASPTLNRNHVHPLPVRWPVELSDQYAIAEVLGALDDKIATNDRIGAISRELLTSAFRALGVDEAGGASLEELIELNPKLRVDGTSDVPYLEMKNLPDSAMTVSEWSRREPRGGARFRNGDTLLARITPCLENGKVGMIDFLAGGEVAVGSTEFIVMRSRPGVPTSFPYFLATSDRFRDYAIRHMIGTTGRQRLAAADLATYSVRRPSSDALDRFGSLADAVLARVKGAVDESRVLVRTRNELLPLLMSGRVRVKDAEKAAEEML